MLNYKLLGADQLDAIDYVFEHDVTYLVATMGFGKSVVTLTAVDELLEQKILNRVLVVAPLKACNDVWKTEHEKWEHLTHLDVVHAIGSVKKRTEAIESGAEIVVINIDNFVWFLDTYKGAGLAGFDGLVIDEISKFKDSGTKLVKKLRTQVKHFNWVLGMTGTPVHESFTGLFSQMLCLDGGKTYGTNKDKFLRGYFYPTDYEERNWELRDGMEAVLLDKLQGCLHVAPDYTHELPAVMESVIGFELSKADMTHYKKFARDSVTVVEGVEIVAENAAVLSGKLGQFASGFLYTPEPDQVSLCVHLAREYKFMDLIDAVERAVICYWYKAELATIKGILDLVGASYCSMSDDDAIGRWNRREVDYLLLHPASAGHGINLASGGSQMIFYSPIWSNDVFKQTVARVWRRGQTEPVTAWILCASGTVDVLKIQRIEDKATYNDLFMRHVRSLG